MSRLCRAAVLACVALCASTSVEAKTLIRLGLPEDHSRLAVETMKAELGRIVSDASLDLEWASKQAPVQEVDGRIVAVELLGSCVASSLERRLRGPLGWTKVVDGRVLPYVEIDCARIRSLITPVWARENAAQREVFLGRALARVVAHELAHALAGTRHHSGEVLRKAALRPAELVSGTYRLTAADFRQRRSARAKSLRASFPAAPQAALSGYSDSEGR